MKWTIMDINNESNEFYTVIQSQVFDDCQKPSRQNSILQFKTLCKIFRWIIGPLALTANPTFFSVEIFYKYVVHIMSYVLQKLVSETLSI